MHKAFVFPIAALCVTMALGWYVVFHAGRTPEPIKVGVLHSLSGTMALNESSGVDATLLAIEEINQSGGVLGRPIAPVVVDGRSDWPTYAREAERLITQEQVSVIFGCWTSASRKMVKPVVEHYNAMDMQASIVLKNHLAELECLSQSLMDFGAEARLPAQVVFDLNLALEEIVTNVIAYAYEDAGEHLILVRLLLHNGEVTVEVEDDGRPFNPLQSPAPDTTRPLAEKMRGGLGLHLVRKVMDTLEYRRHLGKNLLVMKKTAQADAPGG